MKWSTYESVYRKDMISSKPSPDKLIVNDVMNISDVCDVQQQVTYFALLPLSKTEWRKNILNFTEMCHIVVPHLKIQKPWYSFVMKYYLINVKISTFEGNKMFPFSEISI